MSFNHNTFRCGCGVVAALPHAKARSYGAKCEACARRSAESKPLAAVHAKFELHEQRKLVPIDTGDLVEFGPPEPTGGMVAAADNVAAKQREAQYASLHADYGDAANLLDACDAAWALCTFAAKMRSPSAPRGSAHPAGTWQARAVDKCKAVHALCCFARDMATPVNEELRRVMASFGGVDVYADRRLKTNESYVVCTGVDQENGATTFSSGSRFKAGDLVKYTGGPEPMGGRPLLVVTCALNERAVEARELDQKVPLGHFLNSELQSWTAPCRCHRSTWTHVGLTARAVECRQCMPAAVRAQDDVNVRRAGMGSCRNHDYLAKVLYPERSGSLPEKYPALAAWLPDAGASGTFKGVDCGKRVEPSEAPSLDDALKGALKRVRRDWFGK